MRTARLVAIFVCATTSALAGAGGPLMDAALQLPEPDTLFLLAVGAVALLVVRLRSKK